MRERIAAILASLRERWTGVGRRMRILIFGSGVLALVAVLVVVLLYNQKNYVTLYNDLSTTKSVEVIAALESSAIPYVVEGGKLFVEAKDEGRARLQLSTLGFQDAGFSYETAQSGGLTATQTEKDRNYIFSIQDRLQATIELFPEISYAVVNISVPQRSAFALRNEDTPTTASIFVQRKPGYDLTPEQVNGILNLVRGSVQGLTDENITIQDERGDLRMVFDLNEDFNNKKLELTDQVNRQISNAIKAVVVAPYGADKVSVAVMTTLNTDAKVTESTLYTPHDPDDPTNNPLDYAEYSRQRQGDGFAAAEGVPGAQDNVQTPQYAIQEEQALASDYYNGHDILDYLVSSTKEQIIKDGFAIENASAAIVVDAATLPDGERDAIVALASNASGIAPENITVQNIAFRVPDAGPEVIPDTTRVFIIVGISLLLFCIIMIIVLTMLSRRRKRLAEEAAAAAAAAEEGIEYDENGVPLIDLLNQEIEYEPIALAETAEHKLKLQIKDLAESDPEIVAQLIKTWLVSSK